MYEFGLAEAIREEPLEWLLKISPIFGSHGLGIHGMGYYLKALELIIAEALPDEIKEAASRLPMNNPTLIADFYDMLFNQVPIFKFLPVQETDPYFFSVLALCQSENTQGVGRYVLDMIGNNLLPGKQLLVTMIQSLAFSFQLNSKHSYYLQNIYVKVESEKDLETVKREIGPLLSQMRITTIAVQNARDILRVDHLNPEQKRIMIMENIRLLVQKREAEGPAQIFNEFHKSLEKIITEQTINKVKEKLVPYVSRYPSTFDRYIFYELQKLTGLMPSQFIAKRDARHLKRIVTHYYLFKKNLCDDMEHNPTGRHIYTKQLKGFVTEGTKTIPTMGILTLLNLIEKNEIVDETHIFKAVQSLLPNIQIESGSVIIERSAVNERFIYLEVSKMDKSSFSFEELQKIRDNIYKEIRLRIQGIMNPIFMPRNEEEVIKNILMLSREIRLVSDLPEVMISFYKQTPTALTFTVLLVRINTKQSIPFDTLIERLSSHVKVVESEKKLLGKLRKKHIKEALILTLETDKKQYLRKDYSIDFYAARSHLFQNLVKVFGELRDFNGGMITKQNEALHELKKQLLAANIQNDFIVDQFYYSLSPRHLRTLIPESILTKATLVLFELLEYAFDEKPCFFKSQIIDNHLLITVGAINPSIKEYLQPILDKTDFDTLEVMTAHVTILDTTCLTYVFYPNFKDRFDEILKAFMHQIRLWSDVISRGITL